MSDVPKITEAQTGNDSTFGSARKSSAKVFCGRMTNVDLLQQSTHLTEANLS